MPLSTEEKEAILELKRMNSNNIPDERIIANILNDNTTNTAEDSSYLEYYLEGAERFEKNFSGKFAALL